MDELGFHFPSTSISVISRRWKGEHERFCAMKRRLGSGRISPPAGFEPATIGRGRSSLVYCSKLNVYLSIVYKGGQVAFTFEPPHDKTNKMTCAPNDDSDQRGYLPDQRQDWADAQADPSLRWAHMPFRWLCHEPAHFTRVCPSLLRTVTSFNFQLNERIYRISKLFVYFLNR